MKRDEVIQTAVWQFNEAVSYLSEIERDGFTPEVKRDLTLALPKMRDALVDIAGIASGRTG